MDEHNRQPPSGLPQGLGVMPNLLGPTPSLPGALGEQPQRPAAAEVRRSDDADPPRATRAEVDTLLTDIERNMQQARGALANGGDATATVARVLSQLTRLRGALAL